jgi:hypothetical protein
MPEEELTPLEVQKKLLEDYRSCELAIISGAQEYTIGSGATARRLVRPKLEDIARAITAIEGRIAQLTPGPQARRGILYARPWR